MGNRDKLSATSPTETSICSGEAIPHALRHFSYSHDTNPPAWLKSETGNSPDPREYLFNPQFFSYSYQNILLIIYIIPESVRFYCGHETKILKKINKIICANLQFELARTYFRWCLPVATWASDRNEGQELPQLFSIPLSQQQPNLLRFIFLELKE